MSVLDDRTEYLKYNTGPKLFGDFTPFYVTITICSVIGIFLIILNVTFCWCSRHRRYWQDRHTGNRWIQPLWSVTPHNNPPLDLTELEKGTQNYVHHRPQIIEDYQKDELDVATTHPEEYIELHKRESEI
ncbi:uncharacterized protein LOC122500344 [Leptopilina heterotoma]|uniref:uncharacterized protein LOC122500344 n=1 Tax=Leptopilina heterotoma TaxID=63436 RepID=UPI001CA870A1|nr:uncharacterized protein LOC122500344 [Leptopilina heterotoma]XP_043465176.1 uncharacterized protein LOC122500344 [Leptopilina heterotoma]